MNNMARVGRALREPAANLYLAGLVALATSMILLAEALVFPTRGLFLALALPTVVLGLAAVVALTRAELLPADGRLAGFLDDTGLGARLRHHDVLSVLLYCAGIVGFAALYGWFALTASGISNGDESFRWGLIDKRPLAFGYLGVVAFIVFHWLMVVAVLEPRRPWQPATSAANAARWPMRLAGGLIVALLAYGLLGLPLLRLVQPAADAAGLADFHELHSHVHLSALEQIRLGATPYLEAKTQYGLGNQLLMDFVTRSVHFSSHGFQAAAILLNVVVIVAFFVFVQQMLGTGWALLGMIGWLLWPSPPDAIVIVPGWATLTRWIVVPVVALLMARTLLNARSSQPSAAVLLVIGAIWGVGGFLSQENLSGGLLAFAISLVLFGAASGLRPPDMAKASLLFVAGGVIAFVALIMSSVGIRNTFEVLRLIGGKSSLVMAGVSNSFWSDNVLLTVGFQTLNGWRDDLLVARGELRGLFLTYGLAILLPVLIGLLGKVLVRSWSELGEAQRGSVSKFAGVLVGAYVLHFFTLLRSDLTHLAAPSFLLPFVLVMLPVFAWRGLRPGVGRGVLLIVSAALILEATTGGALPFARRIADLGDGWRTHADMSAIYGELKAARDRPPSLAGRYSPLEKYQADFRAHRDFAETEEMLSLLHARLRGRPVELASYEPINGLIASPELFYFLGGFRSLSGMTSHQTSIWLRSEEDAWIEQVAAAKSGCVFFQPEPSGKLYDAWRKSADPSSGARLERIEGRRLYGILACRG